MGKIHQPLGQSQVSRAKSLGSHASSGLYSSELLGKLITLSELQFPVSQMGIMKGTCIVGLWKCTALRTVPGTRCGQNSRVGCCYHPNLHPLLSSISLPSFPKWQKSQSTARLPFLILPSPQSTASPHTFSTPVRPLRCACKASHIIKSSHFWNLYSFPLFSGFWYQRPHSPCGCTSSLGISIQGHGLTVTVALGSHALEKISSFPWA